MDQGQGLRVFIIDDEPPVVAGLTMMLRANGYAAEGFIRAADFFARPRSDDVACVLLDLRLERENGLDVQATLWRQGYRLPVIFLSGQGDVLSTARAMRDGALDFLVKPVDEPQLLDALARAERAAIAQRLEARRREEAEERLGQLTRRERQVCELVAGGLLNKQIAGELRVSENTVKVHRARVMHKLRVDSVAALVRFLSETQPGHSST